MLDDQKEMDIMESELVFSFEGILQETAQHMEEEFYDRKFYFSYSSLNKLLWNPVVFYQLYIMQNKQKEAFGPALIQGKVIHAIILDKSGETLKKDFLVSPTKLPTGKLKTVLDKVFKQYQNNKEKYLDTANLNDLHKELLLAMKEEDYYQALNTDNARIAKMVSTETESYWKFLKEKGDRELIDQDTLNYCYDAAEVVQNDHYLRDLLGLDVTELSNTEVFNEILLQEDFPKEGEVSKYSFGLKGILDNLKIDHDNKLIIINDLKTTSGDLRDFKDSIEKYSYWLQAAIYISIITMKYKDLILNKNYNLNFNFIVVDRNLQTYAFPVSFETMMKWTDMMYDALDKAKYHYDNKDYILPYEFARGEVVL